MTASITKDTMAEADGESVTIDGYVGAGEGSAPGERARVAGASSLDTSLSSIHRCSSNNPSRMHCLASLHTQICVLCASAHIAVREMCGKVYLVPVYV